MRWILELINPIWVGEVVRDLHSATELVKKNVDAMLNEPRLDKTEEDWFTTWKGKDKT